MFIRQFQISLAIALSLSSLMLYAVSVQTQPSRLQNENESNPSGNRCTGSQTPQGGGLARQDPPPDNKRRPGGGLNPSTSPCQVNTNQNIALVPIKSTESLTTSTHPTFLFYIPLAAENIHIGRFSILTRDGKRRIYRTEFKLPKTPGIVSISLPSTPENALAEGEYYQWHLDLYCQPNTDDAPDFDINGWIKRVTPGTDTEIWFDSLNRLAQLRRTSPEDEKIKNDWMNLLKSVELQELAEQPIVGEVEIVNN